MMSMKMFGAKQKAHDIGTWTMQDRIEEVRGKIRLKQRDKEAYFAVSQQSIKDNETLIKNLRKEIKEKLNFIHKSSANADYHVIHTGFQNHKESQLAMQRYTVAKAINEKNEHIFDKAGILNNVMYKRELCHKRLERLDGMLEAIKAASEPTEDKISNQKVRVLTTTLDKMKLKCSSAQYIEQTYKKILVHLEKDKLTLPGRLKKLDQSVKNVKSELQQMIEARQGARQALEQTKLEKERLDAKILKGKCLRDSTLTATKKKLNKLNQNGQEKELRPKKRKKNKQIVEESTSAAERRGRGRRMWKKVGKIVTMKLLLDKLQDKMSVNHPFQIPGCLNQQMRRGEKLREKVKKLSETRKSLVATHEKIKMEQQKVKEDYYKAVEEAKSEVEKLEVEIMEAKEQNNMAFNRLQHCSRIIFEVSTSANHIRSKVESCDWIVQEVHLKLGNDYSLGSFFNYDTPASEINCKDPLKVLLFCGTRLNHIASSFKLLQINSHDQYLASQGMEGDRAQEALVTIRSGGPMNGRVLVSEEDDLLHHAEDFLCNDEDENDQYLSRDTIKFTMKIMFDNAHRKAKRQKQ